MKDCIVIFVLEERWFINVCVRYGIYNGFLFLVLINFYILRWVIEILRGKMFWKSYLENWVLGVSF